MKMRIQHSNDSSHKTFETVAYVTRSSKVNEGSDFSKALQDAIDVIHKPKKDNALGLRDLRESSYC